MAKKNKKDLDKDLIRQQIKVLELIEALENHVIHGVEMSSTQVSAALALLKKTLPDISEAKKTDKTGASPAGLSHEEALDALE